MERTTNYSTAIKALLCVALAAFLVECQYNGKTVLQDDTSAETYSAFPQRVAVINLAIESSLKANFENGTLALTLLVANHSKDPIKVDYINSHLYINAERTVIPEVSKSFKDKLMPGEKELYEIQYAPINSVEHFEHSKYKGDLKQQYSLALNFIRDNNGKPLFFDHITYVLQDSLYQAYLDHFGKEKNMTIYHLNLNNEKFIAEQKQHLKSIFPPQAKAVRADGDETHRHDNFVFVTNTGLTIDGILVNMSSYKHNDTLLLNLQLMNQSSHALRIAFSKCNLITKDNIYAPVDNITSTVGGDITHIRDNEYILKPAYRFHFTLKYFAPASFDSFQLQRDWLQALMKGQQPNAPQHLVNLLGGALEFREYDVVKSED